MGLQSVALKEKRSASSKKLLSFIVFIRTWAVVFCIWWLLAWKTANNLLIPSPISVWGSLMQLISTGQLFVDITVSLQRLIEGYAVGLAVGLAAGIAMGLNPFFRESTEYIVEMLRPISGIAWIPLMLLLFGIGNFLPIFIVFYGAVFPILINTMVGVRTVDPVLVRAAGTMGIRKWDVIRHVIIPSALPLILTGVRTALGLGWMSIVAGEMLGASNGLGYALQYYQEMLQTSDLVAVIVVIGILGYLTDYLVRWIQKRITPWVRDNNEGATA